MSRPRRPGTDALFQLAAYAAGADAQSVGRDAKTNRHGATALDFQTLIVPIVFQDQIAIGIRKLAEATLEAVEQTIWRFRNGGAGKPGQFEINSAVLRIPQ